MVHRYSDGSIIASASSERARGPLLQEVPVLRRMTMVQVGFVLRLWHRARRKVGEYRGSS